MPLPILDYKPSTQNQRVASFSVADTTEETPYHYHLESTTAGAGLDALIWATYRQVFNEQETLQFNRQVTLETQLRNRAISVKDFVRGLVKSERFYELVVAPNGNRRLVEICLKRLLGRSPYNQEEEIAWSIQIASLGWSKFVDALLDSGEYDQAFGNNTVPYQRKRMGTDRPTSFMPRYGADYRDKLPSSQFYDQFAQITFDRILRQTDWARVSGVLILLTAVVATTLLVASIP